MSRPYRRDTTATMRTKKWWVVALAFVATVSLIPGQADAFCGFYVGGAGAKLFNNATMVVMMRDGQRTVLSMQNNYQGPPTDFAMVVPVPVVLQKEHVKTLPAAIFDRVDKLAAPRLVEYWEQDPCFIPPPMKYAPRRMKSGGGPPPRPAPKPKRDLGVTVEAQFEVGEYEIVILSAKYSSGLDTWLREQNYNIPEGAGPILEPYVQQGMKFFVAKVNAKKVKFEQGMAKLSPLRFHYDSEHFALPVRLGLLNSKGTQDLIVHILSPGQRYEVANYDNVTIPTNFDVSPRAEQRFGEFYAALFDEVMKRHPKAVVTEYAWQATGCDPCPGPPLGGPDFATLGGDVLPSMAGQQATGGPPLPTGPGRPGPPRRRRMRWNPAGSNFVLTRLHTRYSKDVLGEDLVFRKAEPIVGGREIRGAKNKIERGAKPAGQNNFQGRYVIRHAWRGPIACKNPVRGRWGGPPPGVNNKGPRAAQDLAFAPRKAKLQTFTNKQVLGPGTVFVSKGNPMGMAASIGQGQASPTPAPTAEVAPTTTGDPAMPIATTTAPATPDAPPAASPPSGGCGACATSHDNRGPLDASLLLALALGLAFRRRRGTS
jgi:hypothetical protein